MDTKEIMQRLDALAAAMVEKGVERPDAELQFGSGNRIAVSVRSDFEQKFFGGDWLKLIYADTPEEALDKADAYVAALPDPNTAAKRQFQSNLAKVIDEGNALSLPKDVMGPLSEGMKAMSENLLTDQRGNAA